MDSTDDEESEDEDYEDGDEEYEDDDYEDGDEDDGQELYVEEKNKKSRTDDIEIPLLNERGIYRCT